MGRVRTDEFAGLLKSPYVVSYQVGAMLYQEPYSGLEEAQAAFMRYGSLPVYQNVALLVRPMVGVGTGANQRRDT